MSKDQTEEMLRLTEVTQRLGTALKAQLTLTEILHERVTALERRAGYGLEEISAGIQLPEVGMTEAHRKILTDLTQELSPLQDT